MKKILFCSFIAIAISACNVTRVVTTQSSYLKSGDTTTTITSKTVETFDAKKNLNY